MLLSEELRTITDEAFEKGLEKKDQKIISKMYNLAKKGECFITYQRCALSKRLINYLYKQGLRFYGRQEEYDRWHTTYPQDECFDIYTDIMIGW